MSRGGRPGPSARASRILVPPTSATSQGVSALISVPLPQRGKGVRVASPRRRLPGDAALLLLAQTGDAEPHLVARLEEVRRLLAHADARRRAGGDDVAGQQRHEMADIAD